MPDDKRGPQGLPEPTTDELASFFPLTEAEAPVSRLPRSVRGGVLDVPDIQHTVRVGAPTPDQATPGEPIVQSLPRGAAHRDRFVDGPELGRGGMGTVNQVFDSVLQRQLAMKVINPEAELNPSAVMRFLEEAQVTAQLEHPNIVPVHDLGSSYGDHGMFFTMKRVTGTTLSAVINSLRGTHPNHDELISLLRILVKVCDALEFAHGRGVVHCDLKPENIMIGSHGQVYVMDWGVSVLRSNARPSELEPEWLQLPSAHGRPRGAIVGTPAYMAPEQAMGLTEDIDERTDVYGLGAVLYEILTGHGPNQGDNTLAILSRAVLGGVTAPSGNAVWDELPPGLCQIAMKALETKREHRYESIRELRRQLERFLDGGGWFATQTFKRGDVIVAEGQQADTAFIIESGECQVFKLAEDRQVSLGHLGPGDVFGETAALSTGVRTASVVARNDVAVRIVTRSSLERELRRNQWLGAFVRALAARFRDADQKLSDRISG
ncbi:MAG: hypothetical protein RJA70_605 [Pseudomonadota bacterium]|jgi:serine/threonine-protein kinase